MHVIDNNLNQIAVNVVFNCFLFRTSFLNIVKPMVILIKCIAKIGIHFEGGSVSIVCIRELFQNRGSDPQILVEIFKKRTFN